jgi:serine/threonine-protein kinase
MWWTRSDGAGKPTPLTSGKNLPPQIPYSFMPDGKLLSWMDPVGGPALWTTVLENDGYGLRSGKSELFLQDSFAELAPMFSPDGHWLAYTSNQSGIFEVYVSTFPTGRKLKISNGGGSFPVWSHNGRELFFRSADNRIMVAAYTVKGDSFEVANQPRVWSEKRLPNTGVNFSTANFDLAPDGKRVAAIMPVETPEVQRAQSHVVLLINFFDELRRRVPVAGK